MTASHFRALSVLLLLVLSMPTTLAQDGEAQPAEEAAPAPKEVIELKNGTRLVGKIVRMTDGVLVFEHESSKKKMEIAFSDVVSIESNTSHRYVLVDGGTSVGAANEASPSALRLDTTTTGSVDIRLTDVLAIDPPAVKDTRHKGNIALSASIEDGTSKSKAVALLWDYEVRFTARRLTLRGDWNYEEEEGVVTDRDASAFAKYDYFFNDHTFFYGTAQVEGDDFDDLNLRTSAGVGIGLQIYDDLDEELFIETGVSFVNEDFIVTPDDRRLASRFSAKYDWNILHDKLRYFALAESFWGYEDHEDIDLSVSTGLRITILQNLYATAQVNFTYDNTPPAGDQRKEFEYLLGLGYGFEF